MRALFISLIFIWGEGRGSQSRHLLEQDPSDANDFGTVERRTLSFDFLRENPDRETDEIAKKRDSNVFFRVNNKI